MKRMIALLAVSVACAAVAADDLAGANRALEAKSYAAALAAYTRLAAAGNAEAQFHLGEMHWYGEGLPQDDAQALAWFEKSAAAGHMAANSALHTMQQRELLKSEIDFYVNRYDGAELAAALQRCQAPVFRRGTASRDGLRKVAGDYLKWQQCYNDFVTALNDAMPAGKLIPARVADLMRQQELTAALARMDQVYARLGDQARQLALPVQAQHDEWLVWSEGLARLASQRVAWRQNAPSSLPCNGVPSRSC
jgi:uncharacterized protein